MNKTFSILIIFLFIISCSQTKKIDKDINILEFKHEKDIKIKKNTRFKAILPFIRQTDSIAILSTYSEEGQIKNFNLTDGSLIDSISLEALPTKKIFSFYYHNDDSIFIIVNAAYIRGYLHDSIFYRINNRGKIKDIYSVKGSLAVSIYNSNTKKDSLVYLACPFHYFCFENNKIFIQQIKKTSSNLGDKNFSKIRLPIGAHIDIKENKYYSHNLLYPYFESGNYYSNYYILTYISLSHKKNTILYGLSHTPEIFEYNYITGKSQKHIIKSCLVDTIMSTNKEQDEFKYNMYHSKYSSLYYNKYTKNYIRIVQLASDSTDSPFKKNKPRYTILLADTNFNVIAEGLLPEGLSTNFWNFLPDGNILINNYIKSRNETNKSVFSVYSLKIKKGKKSDLEKQRTKNIKKKKRKKSGIIAYTKTQGIINFKNTAIVIIPIDKSCASCVQMFCAFFNENQKIYEENNIFFILSSNSKDKLDYLIKQNRLDINSSNLIIDNEAKDIDYLEPFINPKLFIIENKKVILEKNYNPSEIYNFQLDISNYIEKRN